MNIDLSLKGIFEKIISALVLALVVGGWNFYVETRVVLVEMKKDLEVVQQCLAKPERCFLCESGGGEPDELHHDDVATWEAE